MKPFKAAFFVRMSHIFGVLEVKRGLLKPSSDVLEPFFNENTRSGMIELLSILENACVELGLTASLVTVRKIRRELTEAKGQSPELYSLVAELQGRLDDEMEGKFFWGLTIKEAEHYNTPREGWEDVLERFPDTVSDIEEARKCFALSRYPAKMRGAIR